MSLDIGSILEGVVTGITSYGAFIRLPGGNTGLVHISEVAEEYVQDIRQYLKERDTVQVKVLGINNKGKYDLSLKQAKQLAPDTPSETAPVEEPQEAQPRQSEEDRPAWKGHGSGRPRGKSFEDMMGRFMKESEERLLDLKRNTDSKRGRGKSR